jgi:formate hydrogenlyase subunit 3/multisubunit Na+/H+ antiporter MnhD subunit
LGSFILVFAMGFGVLITVYSLKSSATIKRINEYYGAILLAIGGSAGILLSNHLLFLLIFWEIVTAALYILVSTGGKNSNFAATKSFAMIGASDAGFLLGIGMVWVLSGTFVISEINLATTSALPIIAFLLLMLAAITKAGAMPLHTWVPTSGEYAPTSVMALLPAALDKLLGIYLLVLIVTRMFVLRHGALTIVLSVIGAGTILIAVMIAMVQHNLKRLLSYHAVSQVGYMILGIATLTPVGIAGGIFHMLNNAIYKCCLFLCGGAVEDATGTADLEQLGGLGKKMPLTFAACLIAALSISGIPPLNGFASKWMVYQGVVEMGQTPNATGVGLWPIWLVAAMFGSALTLASFVKIVHSMFLSRLPDRLKDTKEAPIIQTLPMLVLALLCVFFGVFYLIPVQQFILPALDMGESVEVIVGSWHSLLATALLLIGLLVGFAVLAISAFAKNARTVPTWTCGEILPNDDMIIPGTHFYKTVSSMNGLRQMYSGQERGHYDMYNHGGKLGFACTGLLRWMHSGILPAYLTWVTVGLLLILFAICRIW